MKVKLSRKLNPGHGELPVTNRTVTVAGGNDPVPVQETLDTNGSNLDQLAHMLNQTRTISRRLHKQYVSVSLIIL